jgi:hypothetical protein
MPRFMSISQLSGESPLAPVGISNLLRTATHKGSLSGDYRLRFSSLIQQPPNHDPIPERHEPALDAPAARDRLVELVQRGQVRVPPVMRPRAALGLRRGVRVRVARVGHYAAPEDVVGHDEGAGPQQAVRGAGPRAREEGGQVARVAGLVGVDED